MPSLAKTGTARWPSLHVTSRIAAADLAAATPPFRGDTLPPPPAYRIAPDTLALVLDVLAALLAAAGVGLVTSNAFALARRLCVGFVISVMPDRR